MRIDIVTIFPAMVRAGLVEGILGRAVASGLIDLQVHDLRDFTTDRHKVVDDTPFGGGPGMVLKAEPIFRAVEHVRDTRGTPEAVLLPSPVGWQMTPSPSIRSQIASASSSAASSVPRSRTSSTPRYNPMPWTAPTS